MQCVGRVEVGADIVHYLLKIIHLVKMLFIPMQNVKTYNNELVGGQIQS